MTNRAPATVEDRIAAVADELTPTDRRIARLIVDDPTTPAFGTLADVARRAGTSGPSVVRFATKLGFHGYSDLQSRTVREGGPGGSWESIAGRIGMSVPDGALPQLRAATDPSASGGEMYGPRFMMAGAPVRRPVLRKLGLDQAIADLWEVSERETGLKIDVAEAREQV